MKASEAFLRYIEPIVKTSPDPKDLDSLEKSFILPLAVWNASAIDLWKGNRTRMSELESHMANAPTITGVNPVEFVRYWLDRKSSLSPQAVWAFSDIKLTRKEDGELVFRAEVRAPDEWESKLPPSWRSSASDNELEKPSCN